MQSGGCSGGFVHKVCVWGVWAGLCRGVGSGVGYWGSCRVPVVGAWKGCASGSRRIWERGGVCRALAQCVGVNEQSACTERDFRGWHSAKFGDL